MPMLHRRLWQKTDGGRQLIEELTAQDLWGYWNLAWRGRGLMAGQTHTTRAELEAIRMRIVQEAGEIADEDLQTFEFLCSRWCAEAVLLAIDACVADVRWSRLPPLGDLRGYMDPAMGDLNRMKLEERMG